MVTGSILRPSLVLGLLICRCGVCVQHPRTYTATLQLQRYEPVTPTPLQHPSPYSSDTPAVPMPHIPATHQEHPRAPAAPTHSYITHSPAAPSYLSPSLSTAVPPQSAQRGCLSLQYSRCGGLAFPEPWGGWRARAGAGGGRRGAAEPVSLNTKPEGARSEPLRLSHGITKESLAPADEELEGGVGATQNWPLW